jgi:hypothetical protein
VKKEEDRIRDIRVSGKYRRGFGYGILVDENALVEC